MAAKVQSVKPPISPSVVESKKVAANVMPQTVEKPVMKKFNNKSNKQTIYYTVISILMVFAGVLTGWALSGTSQASNNKGSIKTEVIEDANGEIKEAGEDAEDAQTAEGTLKEGGIDGDGTYRLERGLGPEKDVALVSTSINLQNFVDKEVELWGLTQSAQNAGWMMDVVKIKVSK